MPVVVATSTVADGSMYTPGDQTDARVIAHRATWLSDYKVALSDAVRVHITYDTDDFCRYRFVSSEHKGEGMTGASPVYTDALVTTEKGVALFLPVADCVAATFYDEEKGVLMVSHLGRHSLEQDGGVRSVQYLVETFGVAAASLKVWLSPAPGKEAYPIFKLGGMGMKEAVYEQLGRAGVLVDTIIDNAANTVTDQNYYSHSAFLKGEKSEDGRFAMMAVMV